MKKYKLIKEYPGSLKLGTELDGVRDVRALFHQYPEYWEEITFKRNEFISCVNKNTLTLDLINIEYDQLARKYKLSDYLKFSTKEAAEEFVLMNKPCLSINDVEDSCVGRLQEYFKKNLIDKVKIKII